MVRHVQARRVREPGRTLARARVRVLWAATVAQALPWEVSSYNNMLRLMPAVPGVAVQLQPVANLPRIPPLSEGNAPAGLRNQLPTRAHQRCVLLLTLYVVHESPNSPLALTWPPCCRGRGQARRRHRVT